MTFTKHPKIHHNEKGELLLNFGEYGQEIEIAYFSADGKRCLTVQEVGIAKIWNVSSNELIAQFQPRSPLEASEEKAPVKGGFRVFIESATLNPDGSLALLGLNDGTARLYSVETKEEVLTLSEPNTGAEQNWSVIRAVNFSPDGALALVGFFSRSVGVWNVKEKTFVSLLSGSHENRLFKKPFVRDTMASSVAATSDNCYVFAGFADMTATVWNLESGETVFDAYNHVEKIVDFWCDGEKYLWATSGGAVYSFSDRETAAKILDTGECWEEIKFAPDGREFLTRDISGTVKRWTLTGNSQHVSEAGNMFSYDATTLAWSDDGKVCAYVDQGRNIIISDGANIITKRKSQIVGKVIISPQNNFIMALGWTKQLEIWSLHDGKTVQTLNHQDSISNAVFSPDEKLIAAGCLGQGGSGKIRPIYVWNVQTGEKIAELIGHVHQVHALAFGPNGDWLVSAGLDRSIRFWQLKKDSSESPFLTDHLVNEDVDFHKLKVLQDESVIIFRDTNLEVWRRGRKLTIPIPSEYKIKWHFTPDEKFIAGAFDGQIIRKWDLHSGREERAIAADFLRPEMLPSQLPDDQTETDFKSQAGAYLWRTRYGNFTHTGDGPRGWVTPLNFSNDERFVVVPGTDQAAVIEVSQTQKYASFIPFSGRLRANCVLPDKILLLNSEGKIFCHQISFSD